MDEVLVYDSKFYQREDRKVRKRNEHNCLRKKKLIAHDDFKKTVSVIFEQLTQTNL